MVPIPTVVWQFTTFRTLILTAAVWHYPLCLSEEWGWNRTSALSQVFQAGQWTKNLHLGMEAPRPLTQPDWMFQHLSLSLRNMRGRKLLNLLLSPQPHFSLTFHNSSSCGCWALGLKQISDVLLTPSPLPFSLSYRNSSGTLRSSEFQTVSLKVLRPIREQENVFILWAE